MYNLFKNIAFQLDPEVAHHFTVKSLSLLPSVFSMYGQLQQSDKFHVKTKVGTLPFPVGIAAGLDKNAELIDYFGQLGVGALEVGTVTPRPQEGNPRPRLFRMPKEKSLRNCMGFNGEGAQKVLSNINTSNFYATKVGINFGKNKITENHRAIDDYLELFHEFQNVGDYYVVNVSSPNTPGLRDLQDEGFLNELSLELSSKNIKKPVLLKISPDMENSALMKVIDVVEKSFFSGIIATNTSNAHELGSGGVSGQLIRHRAQECREFVLKNISHDKEVVGVGGISDIDDLWNFWRHGGKFVQVYTSFIYQGPKMFTRFYEQIDALINYFGVQDTEELIRLAHLEKSDLPKI